MVVKLAQSPDVSEEEFLRAHFYNLLSRLLAEPPSIETLAFLGELEGDETVIGSALGSLSKAATTATLEAAEEEYDSLFHGAGTGGELTPFASYYRTGFVYEKPLADLRHDMTALGIASSGVSEEPEDHIASLCEIMHGLICGVFGGESGLGGQKKFFRDHIEPWAPRFFHDLEEAKNASLYKPVGVLGHEFMTIEAKAFEMTA